MVDKKNKIELGLKNLRQRTLLILHLFDGNGPNYVKL